MSTSVFRRLGRNLGTLLLSFILAVVVWISAVMASDPNIQNEMASPVTIEISGQDPGLMIMGDLPNQVRLTLSAPRSVWDSLTNNPDAVHAYIDLSNLAAGTHRVPIQIKIGLRPVQLVKIEPQEVDITIETLVAQKFAVTLHVSGDPALGFKAGPTQIEPSQIAISGPESLAGQVTEVSANLDISRARESIETSLAVTPLDKNGNVVSGLTINPRVVAVSQPIELQGGYRNVIVKVATTGRIANGYKLTNIFVTPPNVIVFSTNPQLVNILPGYVETKPLDLANASDDFEAYLELDLPANISIVGDSKVLVQVSIAAVESNLTLSLPVDISGLNPLLIAELAPRTVDVIISGPIPVLNNLKASDLRVKVDLSNLGPGIYNLKPTVELLPQGVSVVTIMPPNVEVILTLAPTPTPTPSPVPTPTPSATPSATPKP